MILDLRARLFGPDPAVPGPPCACHRCRGTSEPASRDAVAHDLAAHREWHARHKAAVRAAGGHAP